MRNGVEFRESLYAVFCGRIDRKMFKVTRPTSANWRGMSRSKNNCRAAHTRASTIMTGLAMSDPVRQDIQLTITSLICTLSIQN